MIYYMDLAELITILKCPNCATQIPMVLQGSEMLCGQCHTRYPVADGIPLMLGPASHNAMKEGMIAFWGGGWKKRTKEDISTATKEQFLQELGVIRLLLSLEGAEQTQEMVSLNLSAKRVLEIGCGQGTSSVLFALEGAQIFASDLTEDAVKITNNKFQLLGLDNNHVVQADAEHLPFRDGIFDVIFSSGVLHHTPDTKKAVDEIFRVLKPGGSAVVMLYAKWSFQYFIHLLLVRGILLGGLFRHGRNWLGYVTEANWYTEEKQLNPLTKVYSGQQMRRLFRNFQIISLRKHSFNWSDLFPGIYHIYKRHKVRVGNVDVTVPSGLERVIGRWAGFALVIHVRKSL